MPRAAGLLGKDAAGGRNADLLDAGVRLMATRRFSVVSSAPYLSHATGAEAFGDGKAADRCAG
jgi:hypothetical protein